MMLCYTIAWHFLKPWKKSDVFSAKTTVSIIVPARNEAENLDDCIISLINQDYPKELLEIFVVDDHSEDETSQIVLKYKQSGVVLIKMSDYPKSKNSTAFKKLALSKAIELSNGQLIYTTDADCVIPSTTLSTIVDYYQEKNSKFITAPVLFKSPHKSLFYKILALDFIGMMGVTGAVHHLNWAYMSNGANLAYERAAFIAVDGFKNIDHVASGDDLLLMEKIANKFPGQTGFVKSLDATVITNPPNGFKEFFNQRIRWTSKSKAYKDKKIIFQLLISLLFHVNIFISIVGISLGYPQFAVWICGQVILKILVDSLFLGVSAHFFMWKSLLWIIIPAEIFQFVYILLIGFLGNFKSYEWKGRKVK